MIKIQEYDIYKNDIKSILNLRCDWKKFENKTILITGATGLIGTPLVDMFIYLNLTFSLGLRLLLISRHNQKANYDFVQYIAHDISEPIFFDKKIDFIIHAASNTHPLQYSKYPIETIKTNIFGTWNLLLLQEKNPDCRLLLVTSVEIYGEDILNLKNGFSENDYGYINCNTPRSCYNESKRLSETLCSAFFAEKKNDYVIARISRAYGPTLKADDSKALSQFLQKAINKENIVLKSEGNQLYSYIYSADAASALIFLLLYGKTGEAYNIADEKSKITLKELASMIANYAKTNVTYDIPSEIEKKGYSNIMRSVLNIEKIQRLGWSAQFDIIEGVKRTLLIMQQKKMEDDLL